MNSNWIIASGVFVIISILSNSLALDITASLCAMLFLFLGLFE